MMSNAADPQQIADAEAKAKRKIRIEDEDLRAVMSTAQGRRFLWRLLEQTGIYKLSYTGNSETFFNEGQRNIGLKLLAEMHRVDPEHYILMTQECQLK